MRGPTTITELERAYTQGHLAASVDMTLAAIGGDEFRATSVDGATTFRRVATPDEETTGNGPVERYRYDVVDVSGIDPLGDRADDRLVGLDAELADRHPTRDHNAYPHAYDQVAQFFDSQHAPDLLVQHTGAHRFGGNVGQHGSLGIVQARAPFIAAGAGVERLGTIPRSARMVDVAPTVLRLLGTAPHPDSVGPTGAARPNGLLRRQDGDPLDLVAEGGARHVVVVLLDGCNANVLHDAIASGGAPTIAGLASRGTTLGHGLLASLPTATLANHTTASTGAHPGHSGVLHNMWHDRDRTVTPDLLAMDQMFDAMRHLSPDVETMHQAIHRSRPDACTAALFEFCDTGADISSFAAFREGRAPRLVDISDDLDIHHDQVEASGAYAFMTSVDELATRQAVDVWRRTAGNPLPDLTFLSLSLTDESGHEAGPHSELVRAAIVDSDRRLARVLAAVDDAGATDDTAVLVIADHGMEVSDPDVTDDWSRVIGALDAAGIAASDVADGFIYLRS